MFQGSLGRALGRKMKTLGRSLDETHRNTTKSSSDNNLHLKVNQASSDNNLHLRVSQEGQGRSPSPGIPIYQTPAALNLHHMNRSASPAVLQSASSPAISRCSMLSPDAHSSPVPSTSHRESNSNLCGITQEYGDSEKRYPGPAVPPRNSSLASSHGHLVASPVPSTSTSSSMQNIYRERKQRINPPVWLPPPPPPPPPPKSSRLPSPLGQPRPSTSKSHSQLANIQTLQHSPVPFQTRKASHYPQRRSLAVPHHQHSPLPPNPHRLTASHRSASADLSHLESTAV